MNFLLSKINTILDLHVTLQGNGLFNQKVLKFVKLLHIQLNAKIQMAQQMIPWVFF
jgi:hypothetical protein